MALETTADYPIYYAVSEDNRIARWRVFAHYFMAIPHLFVGYVLSVVSSVCQVISWFAILFTGSMPEGLANFIAMSQRYNARALAFALGLTEQYPPFEFVTTMADPGDYAIRLDVQPELHNRNRLTVGFRFLTIIPIAIFVYIVSIGAMFVMVAAWFAVLFTGAYPVGMRNFVIKAFRLGHRVGAYGGLLTDRYPPFALV